MEISNFQKWILYISLVLTLIFVGIVFFQSFGLFINLIIGLMFGIVMRNSDFSFTANLRDIVHHKKYQSSLNFFKMVLLTLLGIHVVIFVKSSLSLFDWNFYLNEPTTVSLAFFIGSVIFGIGISIMGSAGSGFMKKAVSGHKEFIFGLFFYFVGSIIGVCFREITLIYFPSGKLYMPTLLGWPLALMVQTGLIMLVIFTLTKITAKEIKDDTKNIRS